MSVSQFKLAAIDLDGTLLGPDLKISGENMQALQMLHEHGIEVVIASGRHFVSVQRYLPLLPQVQWVVSFQGAEVSDRERKIIVGRSFMPPEHIEQAVSESLRHDFTPIIYGTDSRFCHLSQNDNLEFYQTLADRPPIFAERDKLNQIPAFKVLCLGQAEPIGDFIGISTSHLPFQKIRTHDRIVEFMPDHVSKAVGLQTLTDRLGISPKEVMAFGDADNDIPMFQWAGLSVAMNHGWPNALASATNISPPGPPESALARAIHAIVGNTE